MSKFKRILCLMVTACMLLVLTACEGNTPATEPGTTAPATNNNETVYQVTVQDHLGTPYADGIVVCFLRNGEQVAIQPVDANGTASKTLEKGEYTVKLAFTGNDSACIYDESNLLLTPEQPELTITAALILNGRTQTLYAQGESYDAYYVGEGCTAVSVQAGKRSYFLFAPDRAGTYRFSTIGEGTTIGYYGSPHFVQENSVAEVVNNAVDVSISAGMIGTGDSGTTVLVIGIDASGVSDCILTVQRIGEPAYRIEDEPWTEYPTTHTPSPFKLDLQAGQTLTYVNINGKTEDYPVVYNEADGFYHIGDVNGPVVYINLGKKAPNLSLQVVVGGDGLAGGAPIRKYFFADDGSFIRKEDYTSILMEYFACMDEEYGVYPLTKDLVYILENGCSDWWNDSSPSYLFFGCNPELGWLFACCYIVG